MMAEWSTWNWINVALIFINGAVAFDCFSDEEYDRSYGGWFNLFASALNGATVARILV